MLDALTQYSSIIDATNTRVKYSTVGTVWYIAVRSIVSLGSWNPRDLEIMATLLQYLSDLLYVELPGIRIPAANTYVRNRRIFGIIGSWGSLGSKKDLWMLRIYAPTGIQ